MFALLSTFSQKEVPKNPNGAALRDLNCYLAQVTMSLEAFAHN